MDIAIKNKRDLISDYNGYKSEVIYKDIYYITDIDSGEYLYFSDVLEFYEYINEVGLIYDEMILCYSLIYSDIIYCCNVNNELYISYSFEDLCDEIYNM